jgi:hypothetical protein
MQRGDEQHHAVRRRALLQARGRCPHPHGVLRAEAGGLRWRLCDGLLGLTEQARRAPDCIDEKVGASCSDGGATCDPHDDCNALLVCAEADPRQQPGGCPISFARYKTQIRYVDKAEAQRRAEQLLALKLASWRYRALPAGAWRQLGFIIDDAPNSPAADVPHDKVDLHGYLSMAVATVQTATACVAAMSRAFQPRRCQHHRGIDGSRA